jgi:hypothetical protein
MTSMDARGSIQRLLIAAVLAAGLGGCGLFGPTSDGTFSAVIPGNQVVGPLVVDVVDHTETVTEILVVHGVFPEGASVGPADPAVLIVTWVGGMCDVRTRLTLEATLDAMRITEATEQRLGACEAAGIMRSIAFRFDPPLSPEFVEFMPGGP